MQSTFRKSEKHAFILKAEDTTKIWTKLESYNKSVTASVTFSDSVVREVDSLSELLSFENSNSKKFLQIEFKAVSFDCANITRVELSDSQYNPVSISSSGNDGIVAKVASEIPEIINGLKPWYSKASRIDISILLCILLAIGGMLITLMIPESDKKKVVTFMEAITLLGITTLFFIFIYYLHKILTALKNHICPIATFAIGQGLQRYNLQENIRWGVVIALIVSMAASFLYGLVT
ncbi:hypothetical protein [Aeromonas allosaccharophila]|uniref:Uncharacterized protein n=1 Tax=Aeromonas allosaccharophila TaxID=656 RepID=A0AAX3NVQ3_9GAMM|nr:hypothetical protein [Aeromonas allosaccharophila]WED76238.1 hypothetical protein PYU98_20495 [Aeromonas allosaccharophila]